jgi:hypothetical protein
MRLHARILFPFLLNAAGEGGEGGGGGGGGQVGGGETVAYVGADGSFAEGWHARPEFAEFKGIERYKTVPELAKAYREAELKLSQRPAEGIRVPGADAKPEEIAAYRKAIGVPEDPKGYVFKPEKIPDGVTFDEKRAGEVAELMHQHGVPLAAAKALAEKQFAYEVENATAAKNAYDKHVAEGMAKLKQDWGYRYDDKLTAIKRLVIASGGDPKDAELFNNPKVLKYLDGVTGMLSEDAIASLKGTVAGGDVFLSTKEEARAIMRDPSHPEHAKYQAGDGATVAKVERLLNAS